MLPDNYFDQLHPIYPRRDGGQGWADGRKQCVKRDAEGYAFDVMLQGVTNYRIYCGRKGYIGTSFVMQFATFMGPGLWFEEYAQMDLRSPHQIAEDEKWRALEDRARTMGFQVVDRSRGYHIAEQAVIAAERARDGEIVRGLRLVKTVGGG